MGGRVSSDVSVSLLVVENHPGRISSVLNKSKSLIGEATSKRDRLNQGSTVGICSIELDLKCPFRASFGEKK